MTDQRIRFPIVGRCLYCGSTEKLGREHIVPFALGGNLVLHDASCERCSVVTRQFEQTCARHIFGPIRIGNRLPTRRKQERPKELPVIIKRAHKIERISVPIECHPGALLTIPVLPPSGIRAMRPYVSLVEGLEHMHVMRTSTEGQKRLKENYQAEEWAVETGIDDRAFVLLIAKIAHCMAAARYGLDNFDPILPGYILGRDTNLLHFVGGIGELVIPDEDITYSETEQEFHQLSTAVFALNESIYVGCRVQLFESLRLPTYEVIVGYPRGNLLRQAGAPPFVPIIA